jgi:3-dehydroquinate dehydratase II
MNRHSRASVVVLHGPNLNALGTREPQVYGAQTLDAINEQIQQLGRELGIEVLIQQHSSEGGLIDAIHAAGGQQRAILINAGAYAHYSYALRDALASVSVPKIEIHLTNIYARESFRRRSVITPVVDGAVFGFGAISYLLGLRAAAAMLDEIRD